MPAKIYSAQLVGLRADFVEIEADVSRGLHSFSIVGLPDKAVEESRDRLNAAIKNSGFKPPQKGNHKIIISLAPADVKKEGSSFDVGMALAYLSAVGEIKFEADKKIFLGELGLDGSIRPVRGILVIANRAKAAGFTEIFIPRANAAEAALVSGLTIYPCDHFSQIIKKICPDKELVDKQESQFENLAPAPVTVVEPQEDAVTLIDFSDIRGQDGAKRGLEIAAAGGHNVAMFGPPGTGKTMLARAVSGILPPLDFDAIIETTGIHSAAGVLMSDLVTRPPFRSPHHTASYVSLVGGGSFPRPGEITLAHRGVLFLDEFPEFEKRVIEALRQPLEDKVITVARAKGSVAFPASFMLVAAMNPCPCGQRGLPNKECICSPGALMKYQRRLSGPIIDRIDLWLNVAYVEPKLLEGIPTGETSVGVRARVARARERQKKRFREAGVSATTNSEITVRDLRRFAPLSPDAEKILTQSAEKLGLSARAYHRVIKLARTIADLSSEEIISPQHILEAVQYRPRTENFL